MGDGDKTPLRLQFNPKVRLEFHGATITSDAGLLPIRELDDALGLTHIAADYLQESRSGRWVSTNQDTVEQVRGTLLDDLQMPDWRLLACPCCETPAP